METIKKEALSYLKKIDKNDSYWTESDEDIVNKFCDFTINSKWVKIEKIKAQIEENQSVLFMLNTHGTEASLVRVAMRIESLQEELKKIEDGTK